MTLPQLQPWKNTPTKPFDGQQIADQLAATVGPLDWDQEQTCAWWTFPAPEGPFAGAVVTLEWDNTGWRWGYSRRPDADIDAVIPMSGGGTTVASDLLAVLTQPIPDPRPALSEIATEDGTVTTEDPSRMNRFVGRAAQMLADTQHTPTPGDGYTDAIGNPIGLGDTVGTRTTGGRYSGTYAGRIIKLGKGQVKIRITHIPSKAWGSDKGVGSEAWVRCDYAFKTFPR
ncbi:hypothetical protein [Nocardiopsis synnemataformans]|uniref:hypothetical protein n=1 Tax=Nocardiopsis synnemataformans TaxID=61305 RepID=UPI003EBA223C